jgi:hypothetical protein
MAANKNFDTDGLAGDWAQPGGVANTDTYRPPSQRGEQRTRVAKDYIDDQAVLENDELAPAWPQTRDVRRSTPESA